MTERKTEKRFVEVRLQVEFAYGLENGPAHAYKVWFVDCPTIGGSGRTYHEAFHLAASRLPAALQNNYLRVKGDA